jgi:hypothetical protein
MELRLDLDVFGPYAWNGMNTCTINGIERTRTFVAGGLNMTENHAFFTGHSLLSRYHP